jgi:hypothetical protein
MTLDDVAVVDYTKVLIDALAASVQRSEKSVFGDPAE